jgi:hypothetical protein
MNLGLEQIKTNKKEKWIGVDLDGTLAYYTTFKGDYIIGDPIPNMITKVKKWIKDGKKVKIFTARVSAHNRDISLIKKTIKNWCVEHIGVELEITNIKDTNMIELWDDRAIRVLKNKGIIDNNFIERN